MTTESYTNFHIYVASSWRNELQPGVVQHLRGGGFTVYDFKNPTPGNDGFRWSAIDPNWKEWTPAHAFAALDHPIAQAGFKADFDAMKRAHAFVLVMPCGRSAHLELGWATGRGIPSIVYQPHAAEPELMYKLATAFSTNLQDLTKLMTGFFYDNRALRAPRGGL